MIFRLKWTAKTRSLQKYPPYYSLHSYQSSISVCLCNPTGAGSKEQEDSGAVGLLTQHPNQHLDHDVAVESQEIPEKLQQPPSS